MSNLEVMQFSFVTQSVNIKRTVLIKIGFWRNTRTKYQGKTEGVHGAVVPVEDIKKHKSIKLGGKKIKWYESNPVVFWDVLCFKIYFPISVST